MSFSVLFVFSLGFFQYTGQKDALALLSYQGLFAIVSLMFLLTFLKICNERMIIFLLISCISISLIACILLPFLPTSLVVETKGARRWLRILSVSIAPTEFLKIGFIYILAWTYSRKYGSKAVSLKQDIMRIAPSLFLYFIIFAYIYVTQNDLGQAVVMLVVLLSMALCAGGTFMSVLLISSCGVLLVVLAILLNTKRIQRILDWWVNIQDIILPLLPERFQESMRIYNANTPYQLTHGLNAFFNGGIFGEGLGLGVFKLGFLSEVHTDFILAGMTEEIGILGLLFICAVYFWLFFSLIKISANVQEKKYSLFIIGYMFCIAYSFLMNIFGILGFIPLKGIAVPFLSYGGSSMFANVFAITIILALYKTNNKKSFYKENY